MKRELTIEEKQERRRDRIAILVIVLLSIAAAVFGILFATAKASEMRVKDDYRALAETTYRKNYYGLVYNVEGMEGALNKLGVASNRALKQEYLADITAFSSAAAENMSGLVDRAEDQSKILKFINQTGDFSRYLDDKLNKGGDFTARDRETIGEIGDALSEIKRTLADLEGEAEKEGFSFVDSLKAEDSLFSQTIRSFSSEEIDYPAMIYDGPFSDSMTERTAKALTGEEITEEECRQKVKELLFDEEVRGVKITAGSKNVFETYLCEAETDRGTVYLTLAKKGGFPVSINRSVRTPSQKTIGAKEAESLAEKYIAVIGIADMKAVWASDYENVYYINLACEKEGVILYPDLIKVKVDGETGEVLGLEGQNYVFNHTEREIESPVVTTQEALDAISEYIEISSCRLAIVPTKGDGEALTYEFYGTKGGDKYFVYVDAASGEELKIMRVLDGERGLLLQ